MKSTLFLSILFCVMAMPALAELTAADLDKIRLIVIDSEKSVKEELNKEIERVETRIEKSIDTQNESLDKRLSLLTTLVVGLIVLIVFAVGIPQWIIVWQSQKNQARDIQIEELTPLIKALIQVTYEERLVLNGI